MTNEMTERVAKALFNKEFEGAEWDRETEKVKDGFRGMAHAAIEAIHEPTDKKEGDATFSYVDWSKVIDASEGSYADWERAIEAEALMLPNDDS